MLRLQSALLLAFVTTTLFWDLRSALALGGTLDMPGIAVSQNEKGEPDPVGKSVQGVLLNYKKDFANGWFVNAHSVMYFQGKAERVNAMLKELADTPGAVVAVKFSKESGVAQSPFSKKEVDAVPCQWSVDHNGRIDSGRLSVTIFLGPGGLQPDEIDIPEILGTAKELKATEDDR